MAYLKILHKTAVESISETFNRKPLVVLLAAFPVASMDSGRSFSDGDSFDNGRCRYHWWQTRRCKEQRRKLPNSLTSFLVLCGTFLIARFAINITKIIVHTNIAHCFFSLPRYDDLSKIKYHF